MKNVRRTHLILVLLTLGLSSHAMASEVPQTLTLDGQVLDPTFATPVLDATLNIKIQILNPAKDCILYEEEQTVNTQLTNGFFNINVGSSTGDPKRTSDDPGRTMTQVFQNSLNIAGNQVADPTQACTQTAATGTKRFFRVIITKTAGTPETLIPDLGVDALPNAIVAQSVSGLERADILVVNAAQNLTQANLEALLTGTGLTNLQGLNAGTSSLYMRNNTTNGAGLPLVSGNPGTPANGAIWFDDTANQVKYYDGTTVKTISDTGSAGEANTASNIGTTGVGLYKQKTGVNLEFKTIAGASGITVTDDVANNKVDIGVSIGTTSGTVAAGDDSRIVNSIQNLGFTPSIRTGAEGAQGAAGTNGRIFIASDSQKIYRDTGATWSLLTSLNFSDFTGTVPLSQGGTNLTSIGTINQVLGVNAAGNALEYKTVTAGTGVSVTHGAGTVTIAATNAGTVTSVTSSNAYLTVATGTTTPALTVNVGTTANTLAAGDDARLNGAFQGSTVLGGDLSGSLPNPTVVKIQGVALGTVAPGDGQWLKYTTAGTSWAADFIGNADLRSNVLSTNTLFDAATCDSVNKTLKWDAPTGRYSCASIASLDAASISTGTINPARLGIGTASASTFLRGDGSWASPGGGGIGDVVGPASSADNALARFDGTTGKILQNSGVYVDDSSKVGVGTSAPATLLATHGATGMTANLTSNSNGTNFFNATYNGTQQFKVGFGGAGEIQFQVIDTVDNDNGSYFVAKSGEPFSRGVLGRSFLAFGPGNVTRDVFVSRSAANTLRISSDQSSGAAHLIVNGNVGIGTASPGSKLHVVGSVRMVDGNEGAGKVMTSDANGVASWSSISGAGLGDLTGPASSADNAIARFDGTTGKLMQNSGVFINDSGNVGIGTAAPSFKLEIQDSVNSVSGIKIHNSNAGASAYTTLRLGNNTDDQAGIFRVSSGNSTYAGPNSLNFFTTGAYPIGFATSNTVRMLVTSAGNVGIGSTVPAATLDVNGTIKIAGGTPGAGKILTSDANGLATWETPSSTTQWTTAGANIHYSSGKVGIGTATPGVNLEVRGPSASAKIINSSNSYSVDFGFPTSSGGEPSLSLYTSGVTNGRVLQRQNSTNDIYLGDIDNNGGKLIVRTAGSEKMRIDTAGKVGIGTTTINATLDVNGTIKAAGSIFSATNPIASGAAVDLTRSNTHTLASVGGSTITLTGMQDGGVYNIVIADTTSRTYTFSGCTTSFFKPANSATTASTRTIYGVITVKNGSNWDCYITWSSGFQ